MQGIINCLFQYFGTTIFTLDWWNYKWAIDVLRIDYRTALVVDVVIADIILVLRRFRRYLFVGPLRLV